MRDGLHDIIAVMISFRLRWAPAVQLEGLILAALAIHR